MTGYATFRATLLTLLVILGGVAPASAVFGQVSDVKMDVDRAGGFVGLGGAVRKGAWTPLRVTLKNESAELRAVRLMWLMHDNDGDRVIYQRRATIDALRDNVHVWLYGTPPMSMRPQDPWTLVMVDDANERVLSSMQVYTQSDNSDRMLPLDKSAIGIMGSVELGLDDYTNMATEHEPLALIPGLTLSTLPDRWYGLSVLDAMVWTWRDGEGGDPNDAAFTPESQEALREWVRRGGHLVIVLPAVDEPWTGSPLEDLLPVKRDRMRTETDLPPVSLGAAVGGERAPISMWVFDVGPEDGVEVIDQARSGNPFVVAKRYGFGRVTLIGADLAHPSLIRAGYPSGKLRVWNKVFRWTYPALNRAALDAAVRNGEMSRPETRGTVTLGDTWIGRTITMTNTAAPILLGAIVVFILYWLAAGPLAFGVLKTKGILRHSWLIFTVVVAAFTLVTWAGAMVLRQGHVSIAHFSVLDIDGRTGEAHAHGWASVFVPTFGDIDVVLDPEHEQSTHTLASPGLFDQLQGGSFPDPRSYSVNAASPAHVRVPMRATSKQFVYDFHGKLNLKQKGLSTEWLTPEGTVTIENFLPKGELTHHLPQPIEDLLVVFCPGDNQRPWVWRHRDPWEPGKPLTIEALPQRVPLTIDARDDNLKQRQWAAEGYLGILVGLKTGVQIQPNQNDLFPPSNNYRDLKQQIEMLSFFSALPPPNYKDTDFSINRETSYRRQFGKALDMTELTSGRRLILIGHIRNSPLPAPLTVDGQEVEEVNSSSWTVLRWVYDLQ